MRPKGFMPLDIASPDTEADDSLHVPSSGAPTHPKQSSRKGELAPDINRFPFCIVWTTLPIISFVFPMIGHTGICNSKGVIHDFAGPYYISVSSIRCWFIYIYLSTQTPKKFRSMISHSELPQNMFA
eukprot:TRINITY_DN1808_c0_g2_i5.p3 TRINITY_DN1808_c0_g2~~TRINITY_DN1808_c0_g2_i5.p3  ORF type:complete len:127 (+),score=9.16 TRINITY_DN1808_c0_g2_i5:118-498(+)